VAAVLKAVTVVTIVNIVNAVKAKAPLSSRF